MNGPSLLVFDDWLPELSQVDALAEAVEGDYRSKQGQPEETRYNWWDGEQPQSVVHQYLQYTFDKLRPFFDLKVAGFEWWGNFNSLVGWHYDKDESLYKKEKQLLHPTVGTVFYMTGSEVIDGLGGAFAVNSDATAKTADHVYPVRNRLVAFRGNRLHRVCDYKGQRISLAVNFWSHVPLAFQSPSET